MSKKQSHKPKKPLEAKPKTSARSGTKKSPQSKEPAAAADAAAEKASVLAPDPRLPAVGTTIEKRDRHGTVRCRCTVETGGVRYAGKVYSSLSGAAMAAAKDLGLKNKTQNGYIFWGLAKPPRAVRDPIEAVELAWQRYRNRVEALVKGVTEENRSKVVAAIGKHGELIEKLAGSQALKGASAK
jgi:hypothetical protein